MKDYNIILPSIDGLLSDDYLYFEGINRPSEIYFIKDGGVPSENKVDNEVYILEKYFNVNFND